MNRRQLIKSAVTLSATTAISPMLSFANSQPIASDLQQNKVAFDKALSKKPELIGFQGVSTPFSKQALTIEGALPRDLKGAFYRNGPAILERGSQRYNHLFEGDGMIQGFYFQDGKLYHQGKFVKTNKYSKEQTAGQFLYSGPDSKLKHSLSVTNPDSINTANTNILPVNGELWALWEAGSPVAINAETLDTQGYVSLGGQSLYGDKLKGMAFSAHPKVSPNGDIWNIGYSTSGHVVLYHLDSRGVMKKVNIVKTAYRAGMLHDFLITKKHILLILPSLTASPHQQGFFSAISYDSKQPMQVLVVDKQSLTVKRQFNIDSGFAFHYGNAWEDKSGAIHFDACLYQDSAALHSMHKIMKGEILDNPSSSHTVLFTLNPNGSYQRSDIEGISEFPRIHDGYCGERNNWLYSASSVEMDLWSDAITATNISNGQQQRFVYGKEFLVEEHIVVSNSEKERQGYLMGTALHIPTKRTCLNIFHLNDIEGGPICRAWLPYHLPLGFHGNFMHG